MTRVKIQFRGQLPLDRGSDEPLSLQIVRRLQEALQRGELAAGAVLPSSRALARTLGVSRNTVLTAYDEMKARGVIRGRRGAGMHVASRPTPPGVDVKRLMREAQYPSRTTTIHDSDGNAITVLW
jgi:GntR family transcriptional regulator/MocR family aminotransferase